MTNGISRSWPRKILTLLTIGAVLSALSGCGEDKDPQPQWRPLGAEADPAEIDEAFSKAMGDNTIHDAQINQAVVYEENYRADLSSVVKLASFSRQLIDIKDTPEIRSYVLAEVVRIYNTRTGAVEDESISEVAVQYRKLFTPNSALSFFSDDDCGEEREDNGLVYDCVKYYNFRLSETNEPVPEATKARPDCGNVPGCALPVVTLRFDRVKFLKGEIVDRETVRMGLSKMIPLLFPDQSLPPVHHFCIGKIFRTEGASVYLNRCTVLRDLQL